MAKEGKSYAEAIRSVVRQRHSEEGCRVGDNSQKSVKAARADNPEGVCRIGVNSLKRADREDVIEATAGRIVSTVSRPSSLAKHQRAINQHHKE